MVGLLGSVLLARCEDGLQPKSQQCLSLVILHEPPALVPSQAELVMQSFTMHLAAWLMYCVAASLHKPRYRLVVVNQA